MFLLREVDIFTDILMHFSRLLKLPLPLVISNEPFHTFAVKPQCGVFEHL